MGFSLITLNLFDDGQAYTEQEYLDWLAEAGFAGGDISALSGGATLISAKNSSEARDGAGALSEGNLERVGRILWRGRPTTPMSQLFRWLLSRRPTVDYQLTPSHERGLIRRQE